MHRPLPAISTRSTIRVLKYLTQEFGVSDAQKNASYRHWVEVGLEAVAAMLADNPGAGVFCHGNTPTHADCCLVPQVVNACRFDCDIGALPSVMRIVEQFEAMDAFQPTKRQLTACWP